MFRVKGFGGRVQYVEFGGKGSWRRIQGVGFRVWDSGFRVQG